MTHDSEPTLDPAADAPERAIDPVLLNAVADATRGAEAGTNEAGATDSAGVLDAHSREVLQETLDDATTTEERVAFAAAIEDVSSTGKGDASHREAISTVVDAVRDSLAERGARVTVDHRAHIQVGATEAALYTFSRTRDPSALDSLSLPPSVAAPIEEGGALVAEGAFAEAAAAFDRAVEAARAGAGALTARTLAGWANHWAGNDAAAIDYVEEALHLDTDAWNPALVGFSAEPDAAYASPQQFRDGKYAAMALLRYTIDCPDGSRVDPSVGVVDGDEVEWLDLSGDDECTPVPRLGGETILRLRLSGLVPAFPAVHGYYLALGIVDCEVNETREVHRLLLDGPLGDTVTETVSVTLPE